MVGTLVTSVLAVVFLTIAGWAFRSAWAHRLWPAAPGTVTGGTIRQKTSGVGDDESVTFVPVVEYRYQIGAGVYAGSGIGFGETGYGSRGRAENVLAKYPVGSAVDVHYNPAKPAQTFLEAGGGVIAWIMLAVGVSIAIAAVVLGINGI